MIIRAWEDVDFYSTDRHWRYYDIDRKNVKQVSTAWLNFFRKGVESQLQHFTIVNLRNGQTIITRTPINNIIR